MLTLEALSDWSSIAPLAINDFEAVVAARHPSIAAIVERLRDLGCEPALMSGSGSSVFGVLPRAAGVEMPRFADTSSEPAPRVLLTVRPSASPRSSSAGLARARRLPAHEFANFQRCHIELDCRSLPRRPMAGHDTLDVGIVVRIHAGECVRSPGQN